MSIGIFDVVINCFIDEEAKEKGKEIEENERINPCLL